MILKIPNETFLRITRYIVEQTNPLIDMRNKVSNKWKQAKLEPRVAFSSSHPSDGAHAWKIAVNMFLVVGARTSWVVLLAPEGEHSPPSLSSLPRERVKERRNEREHRDMIMALLCEEWESECLRNDMKRKNCQSSSKYYELMKMSC